MLLYSCTHMAAVGVKGLNVNGDGEEVRSFHIRASSTGKVRRPTDSRNKQTASD